MLQSCFRLFGLMVLVCMLFSKPARAEFWQGAAPLKAGESALGGFGQFYFNPNEIMAFGQFTYGVTDLFQVEGRLGLGSLDPYYGAFGKFGIIRRKSLD